MPRLPAFPVVLLVLALGPACQSPAADASAGAHDSAAHDSAAPQASSAPEGARVDAVAAGAESGVQQLFVVPDGLNVTLWAESPLFYNPTALDVDDEGRLWVAEAVNYRKWDGRNPGRDHPEGDRIVVLEDRDGDGRAETSTVFAQDKDLVAPLGVAVVGDAVYVSCSPHLFVYRDTDGDMKADERETLLTGFGGFDHDHGLHSLIAGPDGRYTFAVGNAGPHQVMQAGAPSPSDATNTTWTLNSGSHYRGGGPELADNHPGLVSADGKVWTGGLIVRSEADGSELQVLAHNFRNNYEVTVDAFGNLWQSDNDDDGNASCRTLWCMEGGNHGYFSPEGRRSWQADRRPEQAIPRAHWHQDDPGVVPMGTINGGGGPTGVCMYEGQLLSPWIDGAVLNADAGAGVVYAHRPQADGAGFQLEKQDLIRAAPGQDGTRAKWFRPSDVVVGTDGSVFVADWFDPGVGGHGMGDREAYGRILRIAPAAEARRVRTLEPLDSIDAQLRALANPAVHRREAGRAALAAGGTPARDALRTCFLKSEDDRLRARCLWLLLGPAFVDTDTLPAALNDPNPELRITALRAWSQNSGDRLTPEFVRQHSLARDPSPAVRRELALRLRDVDELDLLLLVELAGTLQVGDRTALEAFGLAADPWASELMRVLKPGGTPEQWSDHLAQLAWRLHPAELTDAWRTRALSTKLSEEARLQALDALAFTPGPEAGQTMLDLALQLPAGSLGERARWWLRHHDTNAWQDLALLDALGGRELEDAELLHDTGTLRAGLHELDVALHGAQTLWLELTDGGDGNGCDWGAWVEPRVQFEDGQVLMLNEAPWASAEAAWGSVRRNTNCVGGPLRVGDQTYQAGIGSHANSLIEFNLPEGATRFLASVGPDAQGTSQNAGRNTSLNFRVHANTTRQAEWFAARRALLLDTQLDATSDDAEDQREAAALELAADTMGALMLLELAGQGQLSDDLRELLGEVLFAHPNLAIRALASEHFQRPGEEAKRFPPVAELLALDGDAARGRAIFLDEARSGCLRCHRYTLAGATRGGNVGPELSTQHEKQGADQILDAILNPSAAIAYGYDAWLLTLADGRILSGFLRADDRTLILEDTNGVRHAIPAEEVVERRLQKLSVMPDGIATGLSPQELRDLVAFLAEPPLPTFTRGETLPLFDGHSFEGWHAVGDIAAWRAEDGVLSCDGNPVGYLRTEALYTHFELDLDWRFDPAKGAGNSGVLLRVNGPDSVWPRSVEAQLNSGDAGDIWNIGEFVLSTDPGRTSGRRTVKQQPSAEYPLGQWNSYRIRVAGPLIQLWVNGTLMNTGSWAEETPGHIALQSEGAAIEFRNVRLTQLVPEQG